MLTGAEDRASPFATATRDALGRVLARGGAKVMPWTLKHLVKCPIPEVKKEFLAPLDVHFLCSNVRANFGLITVVPSPDGQPHAHLCFLLSVASV